MAWEKIILCGLLIMSFFAITNIEDFSEYNQDNLYISEFQKNESFDNYETMGNNIITASSSVFGVLNNVGEIASTTINGVTAVASGYGSIVSSTFGFIKSMVTGSTEEKANAFVNYQKAIENTWNTILGFFGGGK